MELTHEQQSINSSVSARWFADRAYEGVRRRLHNRFTATLLEEVAGWAAISPLERERGEVTRVRIIDLHVDYAEKVPSGEWLSLHGVAYSVVDNVVQASAALKARDAALSTCRLAAVTVN